LLVVCKSNRGKYQILFYIQNHTFLMHLANDNTLSDPMITNVAKTKPITFFRRIQETQCE
jgi:hypothetical protein